MRQKKLLFVMFFALWGSGLVGAAEVKLKSFLEIYGAGRINENLDLLSYRTRFHFEGDVSQEGCGFFAAVDVGTNNIINSDPILMFREAYIKYGSERLNLRLGRQIIIWGKADGLIINDVVSPFDYTESAVRDFVEIRQAVDAVQAKFISDGLAVEFVWIPFFSPAIMPLYGSPWYVVPHYSVNTEVTGASAQMPVKSLKSSELGFRLNFNLHGVDLGFSTFYGWSDTVVPYSEVITGATNVITFSPEYKRQFFIGVDFAVAAGMFLLRGEFSFLKDGYFKSADILAGKIYKKSRLKMMLGCDWNSADWSATVQVMDTLIFQRDIGMADGKNSWLVTCGITKKMFREILTVGIRSFLQLGELDGFLQLSIEYLVSDAFAITFGLNLFYGEDGSYGRYNGNDALWLKGKVSF